MATERRFSLRSLLVLTALLGGGGGMVLKLLLDQPRMVAMSNVKLGHHQVYGAWRQRWGHAEELVYMLIVPQGDVIVSSGAGPILQVGNEDEEERCAIVGVSAKGLTCDGLPVDGANEGRVWIFRPTTKEICELSGPWEAEVPQSAQACTALESSGLWQLTLKPIADAESAAFRKQSLARTLRKAGITVPP